jgi:hypothetical protein
MHRNQDEMRSAELFLLNPTFQSYQAEVKARSDRAGIREAHGGRAGTRIGEIVFQHSKAVSSALWLGRFASHKDKKAE